jgi:hypothetical protein
MKFALGAVGAGILWLLKDLLSSQVKAFIPVVARAIVRHQAAKMGGRADESKEAWIADLQATPGELLQLFRAFCTLIAPFWMAVEEFQADPRPFWVKSKSAARKRTWWCVVILALVIGASYPPEPGRYASSFICATCLVALAVPLSPSAKRISKLYGARTYGLQLAIGGLTSPLTIALVVAIAYVPPARHLPRVGLPSPQKTARDPLIFIVDGPSLASKAALTAAPTALHSPAGTHPMILQVPVSVAEEAGAATAANEEDSAPGIRDTDTSFVPVLPFVSGFDPITLDPSTVVMTLPQPLPSPQSYPVSPPPPSMLPAPSNLRVIGGLGGD